MRNIILITIILILFLGCGDKKFNGTYESVVNMSKNLSPLEQKQFLKDFKLISYVLGEKKLIGYTIKDMQKEAIKIREYAGNKNKLFLKSVIKRMKLNNIKQINLHLDHGLFSDIKRGYIYKKYYTIDELESIINANGNYDEYTYKKDFIKNYTNGCIKQENTTVKLCNCIGNKFYNHYGYNYFITHKVEMTDDFKNILNLSAKECIKK
jgi:hypothetical protein